MTNGGPMIQPLILSGGSGTRLWPMSRPEKPKQLLSLTQAETMLQLTVRRVDPQMGFAPPILVANAQHADMIAAQLAHVGVDDATLILEPVARNTAAAIALGALAAPSKDSLLLVMPSDHVIADLPAFHQAVERARALAIAGWLVTFGIEAETAETGYGYIRMAHVLSPGVRAVEHFVEKPDLARATAMLAEGGYCWNAGIFLFRADMYLDQLREHAPAILAAAGEAMRQAQRQAGRILPDSAAFAHAPSQSVDYAIMEQAKAVACAPVRCGWSDVGSWDMLHQISASDTAGNSIQGNVLAIDTQNCLIRGGEINVALLGISDLIVVVHANDLLIMPRGQSQNVRQIIDRLAGNGTP